MNDTPASNLLETRLVEAVKTALHECKPNGRNLSPFRKAFGNSGVNALHTDKHRRGAGPCSQMVAKGYECRYYGDRGFRGLVRAL